MIPDPIKKAGGWLSKSVLKQILGLLIAAFGLVAALAWNDAIQALFKQLFGEQGSLFAKFAYAIIVTAIITIVTISLSRYIEEKETP